MRKIVVLLIMGLAATAEATVRCPATVLQSIDVESGQRFALPVAPVPGVLDYEIARSVHWTINNSETWSLGGSIVTSRVRATTGAPVIQERLYSTAPDFPYSAYYVVTAINSFDNAFQPCAQDFLVNVRPDPVLSRDALRAVVPVAGSLRGANNSTYRTRLTLENPWSDAIGGRVIFHPSGQAGSANDPVLQYSINSKAVVSWDDVVAAMSATGLGSLDIVPDRDSFGSFLMPKVRAQVVSLSPGGGSFGTDVPAIAMSSPQYGAVWTDPSLPSFVIDDQSGAKRLAIGIRTLADSVDLTLQLVAPDGNVRATVTRSYPADDHEQRPLSAWFDVAVQQSDRVTVFATRHAAPVMAGGVIVYLSETDNVTNDVSVVIPEQSENALRQPIVQCSFGCRVLR
jgi:hypothetical protein